MQVEAAKEQSKHLVAAAQKAATLSIEVTVAQLNVESTTDLEAANTVTHGEAKHEAELAKKLYESAQDGFTEADADIGLAKQVRHHTLNPFQLHTVLLFPSWIRNTLVQLLWVGWNIGNRSTRMALCL